MTVEPTPEEEEKGERGVVRRKTAFELKQIFKTGARAAAAAVTAKREADELYFKVNLKRRQDLLYFFR